MPSQPRYPRVNDSWGQCGTCGFSIPARGLTLTRKWGWQCLPGNGRTRGCFDGNWDRDDIIYIYPSGEGSRVTAAPLTNTATEGLSGDPPSNSFYLRDHTDPTIIYLVILGDTITLTRVALDQVVGPIFNFVALPQAQEVSLYADHDCLHAFVGLTNASVISTTSPIAWDALNHVAIYINPQGVSQTIACVYLLYDRSFRENIYQVIFHLYTDPEGPVIEVVRASGPAVGGILLNNGWSYFIDNDMAQHDQNPFADQRPWDNSHSFYVDDTTENLIYFP